jgi:hypothetical protein
MYGWTENHEKNILNPINSSLEIIYCSMMLFNHERLRFVRFVSR